ncbi:protease adaptor protein RcdA [Woodsholea maritima]|uniref:protease adaptor protein RcdA n=1 Tax=Woodsholea maritima TaxID=240237 RepID=UPI00038107AA|nr:DUF1465 family protein [Woodsholea maritima]
MTQFPTSLVASPKTRHARVSEFATSEMFRKLFREGMDLVEETAAYLDGPGRDDAKRLGRTGALGYAAESMALTTRLMQAASWLLTQRAVGEDEMNPEEVSHEKYRLPVLKATPINWPAGDDPCPPRLNDLVERSRTLYERLSRMDDSLFKIAPDAPAQEENPLASQWSALESAFTRPGHA